MRTGARSFVVDALLTLAAVLLVSGPLLFTKSGFERDFTNSLWMAWVAGKMLVEVGHPSLFINTTSLGVFYPLFAFYGGPLYALTGGVMELFGGDAELAFVGITMLGITGAYGGTLWLGRQLGLRDLSAHAAALTVITSAYLITNLYGRGAWVELMVTMAIPPLIASGVHLVRVDIWRPGPILIFAMSMALFTGGHNITLLWGTTIIAGALLILWLAAGAPRRLPYRRFAMLGGLGLVSASLNAWFLLPDIAYAGSTSIIHSVGASSIWVESKEFNALSVVLDPLRRVPRESGTTALYVQAPDWFLAWGLVAAALLLWRRTAAGALRRLWVAAIVIVALILGMILIKQFWDLVSYPFTEIQLPYRLGTYLFYSIAGLVLVGALALQRFAAGGGSRRTVRGLRIALAAACAVSLGLCVWQLWVPNTLSGVYSYTDRNEALGSVNVTPKSWYALAAYNDQRAPFVPVPGDRWLIINPRFVKGDRFAAWLNAPPGSQPIQTDIATGTYLVHVSGLRVIGRDGEGFAVVQRVNGGSGPVHVVVETADSAVIELGWIASIAAAVLMFLVLVFAGVRARRTSASSAPATAAYWPHPRP